MNDNLYCLILAGGKGRRLWPESTTDLPKQFIDFFGSGRSILQQTYDHYRRIFSAKHIFISTNTRYKSLVKEQLPELEDCNILAEPIWRNTAPSVAWCTHRIHTFCQDAAIVISPSDIHIIDDDKFSKDILRGGEFVSSRDNILVMGIKPTRPEPGYGYIQIDDEIVDGIYKTKSYTEKPEREFAKMFMESGEFYWHSGIIMVKAEALLRRFKKLLPSVLRHINAGSNDFTIEDENRYIEKHFPSYPNISLEVGILDKEDEVDMMICDFGWADLGTWHGIYEAERKNEGDNVVFDSDVIVDNAHNNIIKVPKGHTAVINGLNGYIIVEKGDMLLVCPKEDSSALIRKYSAEIEIRG